MLQDLSAISSNDLIEMLIKDLAFYRELCNLREDGPEVRAVLQHLDQIIAELEKRNGIKQVLHDKDLDLQHT